MARSSELKLKRQAKDNRGKRHPVFLRESAYNPGKVTLAIGNSRRWIFETLVTGVDPVPSVLWLDSDSGIACINVEELIVEALSEHKDFLLGFSIDEFDINVWLNNIRRASH